MATEETTCTTRIFTQDGEQAKRHAIDFVTKECLVEWAKSICLFDPYCPIKQDGCPKDRNPMVVIRSATVSSDTPTSAKERGETVITAKIRYDQLPPPCATPIKPAYSRVSRWKAVKMLLTNKPLYADIDEGWRK